MEMFYLEVARHELQELRACSGSIVFGTNYSAHFRHAVVSSVFAAFAVEHALTKLVWAQCVLAVQESHRREGLDWIQGNLYRMSDKLRFLRNETNIPNALVDQMKKLFDYRNWLAHPKLQLFEGNVFTVEIVKNLNEIGRGEELDRATRDLLELGDEDALRKLADEVGVPYSEVNSRGVGTPDLEITEQNVRIAEAAVQALQRELSNLSLR